MSFTYNDEGLRTSKTVNGATTTYLYDGTRLIAEYAPTYTCVYIYDEAGAIIGARYISTAENSTWQTYFFEKNLQGDVIAVYSDTGTKLISYRYDAWGNRTTTYSNGGASTLAANNRITYRGYYYDSDLGMYYLQSRYYDAKICRFINADVFISTGQGLTGNNMFAYCGNNPVNRVDPNGESWKFLDIVVAVVVGAVVVVAGVISAPINHCINLVNEKKIASELKESYTKEEAKAAIDEYLSKYQHDSDKVYLEYTTEGYKIHNSCLVKSRYDRQYVSMILSRTNMTNREYDNLSAEWFGHNLMNFIRYDSSTANADLEYYGDGRGWIRDATRVLELLGFE